VAVRVSPALLISSLLRFARTQTDPLVWLTALQTATLNEATGGAPFATGVTKENEATTWIENLPAPQRLSLIEAALIQYEAEVANALCGITGVPGNVSYAIFARPRPPIEDFPQFYPPAF